jgi:hypothetical protein
MITKPQKRPAPRRPRPPLDVHLTVRFRFGEEASDQVTVMDDRRIPMVDSVFKSRDRIVRGFVALLLKTGMTQPKVARELFPVLKFLRRKGTVAPQ